MSTHDDLIKLAAHWLFMSKRCALVVTDMASQCGETPDAIGWKNGLSYLVECKASRADFLADKHKRIRHEDYRGAMGTYRYFLAPAGMLVADDIPALWGHLEPYSDGKSCAVRAESLIHQTTRRNEIDLLVSACRRRVIKGGLHGQRCRCYQFDSGGEARATIGVAEQLEGIEK